MEYTYLVISRNGVGDATVGYEEGEYPSAEAAMTAAQDLRASHPHASREVRQGWYTRIEVYRVDALSLKVPLYRT